MKAKTYQECKVHLERADINLGSFLDGYSTTQSGQCPRKKLVSTARVVPVGASIGLDVMEVKFFTGERSLSGVVVVVAEMPALGSRG